ncbi:MAG: chalcone isomerase family protein [Casimicrobiaceae bacterium]
MRAASAAALAIVAGAWIVLADAAQRAAPVLPAEIRAQVPALRLQGSGELTFFGLSVYDGYYWSVEPGFSFAHPFALDLVYRRAFHGHRIAARSVDEMEKLGHGTPAQRQRWGDAMASLFPDVAKGDRLTGYYVPGGGVRYFHNGAAIGAIDDTEFARAFFAIWFDPRSSRADFRSKLLGEAP